MKRFMPELRVCRALDFGFRPLAFDIPFLAKAKDQRPSLPAASLSSHNPTHSEQRGAQ